MREATEQELREHADKHIDELWAKCATEGLQDHERTALTLLCEWTLRQDAAIEPDLIKKFQDMGIL